MTFSEAMVYISRRKEADGSGLLETLQYMQDNLDEFDPTERRALLDGGGNLRCPSQAPPVLPEQFGV
jgi:hypothetical protein